MFQRCLLILAVVSLALSGSSALATSLFVDISATDGYAQATPTGVATGGYAVLQGPMPTQATLFYDTFTYPGGTTGTMTNITTAFTTVNGRVGSTNMNANGQFVACQTSPTGQGGWIYANGTATALPPYPSTYATDGIAINNNGDTGGFYLVSTSNEQYVPYVRTGGTDYGLTPNSSYGSIVTALNTSGQAVGWLDGGTVPRPNAQVWTYTVSGGVLTQQSVLNVQGNATTPGPLYVAYPNVFSSVALGINSSGNVAIAANNTGVNDPLITTGSTAAFLYNMTSQTCTPMTGLNFYDNQAATGTGTQYGGHGQAINDSGEVVGFTGTVGTSWNAAVWQNGVLTNLQSVYGPSGLNLLNGFVLNNATAIDNNGDIVGVGTDSSGHTNQAFEILNVAATPEPGALTLLAAGLVGLLAYVWRKRK
jgi:hypothetical protein